MPITWALFVSESPEPAPPAAPVHGWSLARYRVGQVVQIRGQQADAPVPAPGSTLQRWEGPAWPTPLAATGTPPAARFAVRASIQHLVYTGREQRDELLAVSSKGSGPTAVIIPLRKSDAWWAMAQDERQSYFLPGVRGRGHTAIGRPYAEKIFRRLYHARYAAPGPTAPPAEARVDERWDFVTYFEFAPGDEALFRSLLAELRDPVINPEWAFVEREMEIWTTKLA